MDIRTRICSEIYIFKENSLPRSTAKGSLLIACCPRSYNLWTASAWVVQRVITIDRWLFPLFVPSAIGQFSYRHHATYNRSIDVQVLRLTRIVRSYRRRTDLGKQVIAEIVTISRDDYNTHDNREFFDQIGGLRFIGIWPRFMAMISTVMLNVV